MAIYLGSNKVDGATANTTVVDLTQAEYDALTTEEKNNGTVYCVSDASGTYLTASEVSYGSSSVQDALDEIDEKKIMEMSVTGTTGNFGELNLNLPNNTYAVLNAVCTSASNIFCLPYITGSANAVVLFNMTDFSRKTNTSATVKVFCYLR